MNATSIKIALALSGTLMIAVTGCQTMDGPRPPKQSWTVQQEDVNAIADCQAQAPGVRVIWDPLTGHHLFEGENAEQCRQCLKTKHGWFELGPPEWAAGTMAPPR
jgi:hypothetical protein